MSRLVKALAFALALTIGSAAAAFAAVADRPESTTSFNGTVYSVLYVGNTVYVGGQFTAATDSSGTVTRNNAAAIDATTGQLLGWNPNANAPVRALASVPAGIALGGAFGTISGAVHNKLAVVNAVTGASTSFAGSANRVVRALATGPDGRLYVGGGFTSVSGQARSGLAAFDGNTLSSWAPKLSGGSALSLHTANGWVLAGGTFTAVNGAYGSGYLAALGPSSGGLVSSWDPSITIPVHAIDSDANKVYAAADGSGGRLSAYLLSGGGSRAWSVATDGGVQAVSVVGSDVYFGGHFDNIGTVFRRKLALVNTSGVLQSWNPRANSAVGVCALDTNGTKLGVGGAFTTFKGGGVSQPHFAQFS